MTVIQETQQEIYTIARYIEKDGKRWLWVSHQGRHQFANIGDAADYAKLWNQTVEDESTSYFPVKMTKTTTIETVALSDV